MYRWNTADRRGTALRISVEKWGKGNEGRAKYNQLDYARNERGRGENAGEGKNEIEISRHIVHIFHRLCKTTLCLLVGNYKWDITKWMCTRVRMKRIADRVNRIQTMAMFLSLLYYNNRGSRTCIGSFVPEGWTDGYSCGKRIGAIGATSDNRCSFHRLGVKRFGHRKAKGRGGEKERWEGFIEFDGNGWVKIKSFPYSLLARNLRTSWKLSWDDRPTPRYEAWTKGRKKKVIWLDEKLLSRSLPLAYHRSFIANGFSFVPLF